METKSELALALARVQARSPWVKKTGYNRGQKYPFLEAAVLLDSVREIFARESIAVLTSVDRVDDLSPMVIRKRDDRGETYESLFYRVRVWLRVQLVHGPSGESHVATYPGEGVDPGDKASNKGMTAALKYALQQLALVPAGDDPEADSRTDEAASARAERRQDIAADSRRFDDLLERQVARLRKLSGKEWTVPSFSVDLRRAYPETCTEDDVVRFTDTCVDALDLSGRVVAGAVRRHAVELAGIAGHPRYLCEAMLGTRIAKLVESSGIATPTTETVARAAEQIAAELQPRLRDEALSAIDSLHGAVYELEDLRKLGLEEAGHCEAVFNRAQELCGHEAFRR